MPTSVTASDELLPSTTAETGEKGTESVWTKEYLGSKENASVQSKLKRNLRFGNAYNKHSRLVAVFVKISERDHQNKKKSSLFQR